MFTNFSVYLLFLYLVIKWASGVTLPIFRSWWVLAWYLPSSLPYLAVTLFELLALYFVFLYIYIIARGTDT